MKNGIPFDLAFTLDDTTRAAFCIRFSEMEGAKFSWDAMAFEEQK